MSAPATPDAALPAVIRAHREACHLTQEAVAHRAKLTVAAYARIERGDANPTWATVRAIARALGLSMRTLGGRVDALRPSFSPPR